MKKKIKLVKAVEINGEAKAIDTELTLDVEQADALIAAGDAELLEVVEEEKEPVTKEKAPTKYTFAIKAAQKKQQEENKPSEAMSMLEKETDITRLFNTIGATTEVVKKEAVQEIFTLLKNTLYEQATWLPATNGRFQNVLDIDQTEIAQLAQGCPLPEGSAPKIWGMMLGKYGSKVPICLDDIEDEQGLVTLLKSALRLRGALGVDAAIVNGQYSETNGGILGLTSQEIVTAGAMVEVPVSDVLDASNVVAYINKVLSAVFLPLRPHVTLVFGGTAFAALQEAYANSAAKCCTLDEVNMRYGMNRYHLSPAQPEEIGVSCAFMPAFSGRERRAIQIKNCDQCGNETSVFDVSFRKTGRLTGIKTGARLLLS